MVSKEGGGPHGLKAASAGIAEKVSRLKLRRGGSDGLGTFETLEFLALGVLGKLALWEALALIALNDSRLSGVDFVHLVQRAKAQHARVEERRLEAAQIALRV